MAKITTFLAAFAVILGLPLVSFGASFAYVNQSGDVSAVTADTALIALATAPNIHIHSGVILLDSPEDSALVGSSL